MANTNRRMKVFLSFTHTDRPFVRDIYQSLLQEGYDPWLDTEKLIPGVDWDFEILKAIHDTDVALVFLSKNTEGVGFFQKEIKTIVELWYEHPDDSLYMIPVRIEECDIPKKLQMVQWVDLFDENGWKKLLLSLEKRKTKLNIQTMNDTGDVIVKEKFEMDTKEKNSSNVIPNNKTNDSFLWKLLSIFQKKNDPINLVKNISDILNEIISPGGGNVEKIASSQIKLLTSYYSLVLDQAQRSFSWALIWATIGVLGFITAGVFLLVYQINDIALIGTIGSVLVEVISAINFYLYNKASAQLAEFHIRLDSTQKLLLSNAVAEKIEGELKQITRSHIALKFAGIDVKPEVVKESLDLTLHIHITRIELNPTGSDMAKEFVTIENSGKIVADMTNWSLSDEAGHTFKFPLFFLKPGMSVNIWTRNGKNKPTDLYWKMKRAIWNNNEDVAYLKDNNGVLVDTFKYSSGKKK